MARCNQTGYYEDERDFREEDARLEAAEAKREARFEAQAEEMLANMWDGFAMPDDYRAIALGMARELGKQINKERA